MVEGRVQNTWVTKGTMAPRGWQRYCFFDPDVDCICEGSDQTQLRTSFTFFGVKIDGHTFCF